MSEGSRVQVLGAEFSAGAPAVDKLPKTGSFEIAIVGRSNVGKSSFINRICERRKLARTSSTPGQTHQINLFSIVFRDETGSERAVTLADLPGYGYAKRSKGERKDLQRLIEDYLMHREHVGLLCLLTDVRRGPEEEELTIQELAGERELPLLVVATKTDKLSRSEASKALKAIAGDFRLDTPDILATGEGVAKEAFWRRVVLLMDASGG